MSVPNDDPWQDLLSDLGVAASAASPAPPPPASTPPAALRRVPAPPKPAASPAVADWNSLAANLGVSVSNAPASPTRKPDPVAAPTVNVGGVEIVRAVRGPGDVEPPLAGSVSPRSSEDRAAESGDSGSREQRPRSERSNSEQGDSNRGGRGEQRGRDDRSRGGRDRGDRGGRERGDRPRSEQGRSEQPRSEQGRGRGDRPPQGARPVEPISPEARPEREAAPRAAAPRSDEPRRSDSRRGGRDRGDRSRGPRDPQRDSRRPQGQRDEPRPPIADTPRLPEARRYRDDEDDDLDDLRAPIRSAARPGEPQLDSSQAVRKLWDDEVPPASTSGFDVFGIIDEKIGGPPIIERHVEEADDELIDDEPVMGESRVAAEGELETTGDRPCCRRRRRGGRSGRRPEGTSRPAPRAIPREGDEPLLDAELDAEPFVDGVLGIDADDDAPRTGRRRRRRRTGRSRDDKSPRPATAAGDLGPAIDDADDLDLEPIRSREGQPHEDDDAEDQHHKHLHRDVTPWKEAIGFLVSANIENRSRSPRSSERRGYRGGRDRG